MKYDLERLLKFVKSARLAPPDLKVTDESLSQYLGFFNAKDFEEIFSEIEKSLLVDVSGVSDESLFRACQPLPQREDVVNIKNTKDDIMSGSKNAEGDFFIVPNDAA